MRPDDTAPDGAVLIPLRARDGSVRAFAVVDAADAAWANQWRWSLDGDGYAVRSERRNGHCQTIRLNRELLGLKRGDLRQGDHRDRDRLNNRRSNLRGLPDTKNAQNVSSFHGSASQYRGVYWDKRKRKWRAQVNVDSRTTNLGYFTDEREAAEAACAARGRLLPYAMD